ncbi:zinc-dependent metalloprotease [Rothia sp. BD8]|uniref:Hydrolase n=1 Tax=Rothia kristinae TaxID=37923 RepID=A0A199NTQ8_9MICC|nr:zinc-dependent metalloprotease [Rothia kristinae]MED6045760.1 zinc-dependent metalloprotease [Rothia kristinae]OAX52200.1 hydrolase [Rothia kristinae]
MNSQNPDDRESHGEGDGNPFEELFRRLSSGQGLNPEDLRGMSVPMDPAMMSGLFSQIQAMMSGMSRDGSVNWEAARDHARQLAAAESDPSLTGSRKAAVRDAMQLAGLWLDAQTQFSRPAVPEDAWVRVEWVDHCFDTFRQIAEPVAASVSEAMGQAMTQQIPQELQAILGQGASMLSGISGMMFAMQLGQAVGQLSREAVSSTDIGIPLAPERCALVPTNIAAFGEGLDLPEQEIMLFLALREAAHQRLFHATPWLRQDILELIRRYSRGIHVDMDRIEEATRSLDPTDPESMRTILSGDLFTPQLTEDQEVTLRRLETLLALVEGWVDDVCARAAGNLPSAPALTETLRRRRAAGGPAEKTFGSLIGLELRPRRLREASEFWRAYGEQHGAEARDALWEAPENLPTDEDLDHPEQFESTHDLLHATDEEMDAALEKLLSGGYEDGADSEDPSSGEDGEDSSGESSNGSSGS